jgi:hypothetical protein
LLRSSAHAYPSTMQQAPPRQGFAVASLVLGIVGAVFGLVPLTALIALACGILAVVFGALGLKQRRGMALAGLILGVVAVALAIWGLVVIAFRMAA